MYKNFSKINGQHPWRKVSPKGYVDYPVKYRDGGKVVYFNFPLAKEMGLISKKHPAKLSARLEKIILKTFSLQVLNEYDWMHKSKLPKDGYEDRLYMATRYLQSQHKNKRGESSGDGRSIWNGYIKGAKTTFDVSSCGTGVTRLSPGFQEAPGAIETGDTKHGYGSGLAELDEMLGSAIMSEIFYRQGLPTERCLTVIAYSDKTAIGVRTAPNLVRPAHIFRYLKSDRWQELKNSFEFFLKRQEANSVYKLPARGKERYAKALEYICRTYAKLAAVMEEEYIFNWLAWDGDNLLANGAILDYGSIRQFAAKHSKYRYRDVDRYSTSLTEQKYWARHLVQTFIQASDFIVSKKKKRLDHFNNHPLLNRFDQYFMEEKDRRLLLKIGFDQKQIQKLLTKSKKQVEQFKQCLYFFEDLKVKRGEQVLPDGINHRPVFLVRNILREMPHFLFCRMKIKDLDKHSWPFLTPEDFCKMMAASYVDKADLVLTDSRRQKSLEFQHAYRDLIFSLGQNLNRVVKQMEERSSVINFEYRQTGDGLIWIVYEVIKMLNKLDQPSIQEVIMRFIESQVLVPGRWKPIQEEELAKNDLSSRLLKRINDNVVLYSDSI